METGILAPFSEDVEEHTVPNSVLHANSDTWIYTNGSLPPESWQTSLIKESLEKASLPTNDLYGGTTIHVRDTLCKFCEQISRLYLNFEISNLDLSAVPQIIQGRSFDRIAISNVMDYRFHDLLGLHHFLRRPHHNPHATFITHFDRSIHQAMADETISASEAYQVLGRVRALCLLSEDLPTKDGIVQLDRFTPLDQLKTLFAEHVYTDHEMLFQMLDNALGIRGHAYVRRLQMKSTNTIVPDWLSKLKRDPCTNVKAARDEYFATERHHFQNFWERYVEWKFASVDDVTAGLESTDEILMKMWRNVHGKDEETSKREHEAEDVTDTEEETESEDGLEDGQVLNAVP